MTAPVPTPSQTAAARAFFGCEEDDHADACIIGMPHELRCVTLAQSYAEREGAVREECRSSLALAEGRFCEWLCRPDIPTIGHHAGCPRRALSPEREGVPEKKPAGSEGAVKDFAALREALGPAAESLEIPERDCTDSSSSALALAEAACDLSDARVELHSADVAAYEGRYRDALAAYRAAAGGKGKA